MTQPPTVTEQAILERLIPFPKAHFLAASDLNPYVVPQLLDLGDAFVDFNRQSDKALGLLHGRTVVNLFFLVAVFYITALLFVLLVLGAVRLLSVGITEGHHPVRSRVGWQIWATERILDAARDQVGRVAAGALGRIGTGEDLAAIEAQRLVETDERVREALEGAGRQIRRRENTTEIGARR